MAIDWTNFTPLSSAIGGCLIGLSAALLVLFKGRIAGISGIVGGLLQGRKTGDFGWRIAFVAGLILAPYAYQAFSALPAGQNDMEWGRLLLAGLLVGFGTRLGSGCTSGHGVCGLSRLAPRSLVATLTFMGAGGVTVFISRHLIG